MLLSYCGAINNFFLYILPTLRKCSWISFNTRYFQCLGEATYSS